MITIHYPVSPLVHGLRTRILFFCNKEDIKRTSKGVLFLIKTFSHNSLPSHDEYPHARKTLSAYFSTKDWLEGVSEASDGEEALEKIKYQTPDMVLINVQMPGMDGLQATQTIKNH